MMRRRIVDKGGAAVLKAVISLMALCAWSCGPRVGDEVFQANPEDVQALVDTVHEGTRICAAGGDVYFAWCGLSNGESLGAVFVTRFNEEAQPQVLSLRLSDTGVGGMSPTLHPSGAGVEVAWLDRTERGKNAEYSLRLASVDAGGTVRRTIEANAFGKERHPLHFYGVRRGLFLVGVSRFPDDKSWRQRVLLQQDSREWVEVKVPGADESGPENGVLSELEDRLLFAWISQGSIRLGKTVDGIEWTEAVAPITTNVESLAWVSSESGRIGLIWSERQGLQSKIGFSEFLKGSEQWKEPQILQTLQGTGINFVNVSTEGATETEVLVQIRETETGCKSLGWFTFSTESVSDFVRITDGLCRASQNAVVSTSYNGVMAAWPQAEETRLGIQIGVREASLGAWEVSPERSILASEGSVLEAPVILLDGRDGYIAYYTGEKKAGISGIFGRAGQRSILLRKLENMIPFSVF